MRANTRESLAQRAEEAAEEAWRYSDRLLALDVADDLRRGAGGTAAEVLRTLEPIKRRTEQDEVLAGSET